MSVLRTPSNLAEIELPANPRLFRDQDVRFLLHLAERNRLSPLELPCGKDTEFGKRHSYKDWWMQFILKRHNTPWRVNFLSYESTRLISLKHYLAPRVVLVLVAVEWR